MKINKNQLKIYIPIVVGVLLVVILTPIKQLSFVGVSKCGRVWNAIDKAEGLVSYLPSKYPINSEIEINLESTDYIFFKYLPDDVKGVWTLGTNNPSCFNETQKIYIAKIGEPYFHTTVAKEVLRSLRLGGGGGSVTVRLGKYVPISQN
jgi:hypothetical protein